MAAPSIRVNIDDTLFTYKPNFEGRINPNSQYPSHTRSCQLTLTDEKADELAGLGFRVKQTKPSKNATPEQLENFKPRWYIDAELNYRDKFNNLLQYPPKVYLITGNTMPVELFEDNANLIDDARVANVKAILNGRWTTNRNTGEEYRKAYINAIYVEQEINTDPYLEMYRQRAMAAEAPATDDDEIPFE